MLGCNQSTIDRHLHEMGKVNKLGTWVPHQLTLQQRISICHFLLSKPNRHRFLQQIITSGFYCWINPEDFERKKLCCLEGILVLTSTS